MSHLGSVRGDHLAVEILLPPPDCLEGGAAGEVEHDEGRGGVSKEYLQVGGARLARLLVPVIYSGHVAEPLLARDVPQLQPHHRVLAVVYNLNRKIVIRISMDLST